MAEEIASGHAFKKHVLLQKEFPSIKTKKQFQKYVEKVIAGATDKRYCKDGRIAMINHKEKIIIWKNNKNGESTMFKPTNWKQQMNVISKKIRINK